MRRLGPRLLFSQVGISILLSLILGFFTLSLARSYFIESLEGAMDVQAELIRSALFPGSAGLDEESPGTSEFNIIQQQVGNLTVEVQEGETSGLSPATGLPGANQKIQAFETIELAVGYTTLEGQHLIQPERLDLPASFLPERDEAGAMLLHGARVVKNDSGMEWLVKSYLIATNGSTQGMLTLGQPLGALASVLRDLAWRIAGAGLLALLVAILISIISTRGLLAPVNALMRASRSIPMGEFHEPLPLERKDELGELSRTFEEMRGKLEALERLRSQFISDVSHELRTPLTAIKGLIETLQDGAVEDPLVRDRFLSSIEGETDRLIRMTQDLLVLTRIDTQSLSLSLKEFDLREIVERTIGTLKPGVEAKAIAVRVNLPSQNVLVRADQDRLIQILYNLLDNAIKHTPINGEIEIGMREGRVNDPDFRHWLTLPQPAGGIRPGLHSIDPVSSWCLLSIQDNGPGIMPSDLVHIFERFYRSDSSRERSSGGAGLGLAIAAALARTHDGFLWLHSPPPVEGMRGTLALLLLPMNF